MIEYEGGLKKMQATLSGSAVEYALCIDDKIIPINSWIGRTIQIQYQHAIACTHCQRPTKKSFGQGHCYPCFTQLAACDQCILKPELCHHHLGTCREPDWGLKHCMQTHVVYLAMTSGYKVGITRKSQVPTRWIDQGAVAAVPLFETHNRRTAGLIEVQAKTLVSDRTQWRKMLQFVAQPEDMFQVAVDLQTQMLALAQKAHPDWEEGVFESMPLNESAIQTIEYPVEIYPEKISSINLEKPPEVEAKLLGIKGQYIITDKGVMNIRKYTGYQVKISC